MNSWTDDIEQDLQWREAELASLKGEVERSANNSVKQMALLRALWALLYAHYEGFCKFAWDLYLEEVAKSRLPRKALKERIIMLSLEKRFREFRGNTSSEAIWAFYDQIYPALMNEPVAFELKLETESNLWPNVLCKNCEAVHLPHQIADIYRAELDTLVARRNDIAHGKKMIIKNLDEYQKYHNATLLVMHELGIAVVEALESRSYVREIQGA